jgi:myo-inositol-1(or 4)-monophosphatase
VTGDAEAHDPAASPLPRPDDPTLIDIEQVAVELVRDAGQLVAARYDTSLGVDFKGEGGTDPVTEVDRLVEARLGAAVAERFPDHALLGEEGADPQANTRYTWVVDPIDGTANYINRIPLFAISVGVLRDARPVVGVVGLPLLGDVLHARAGGGTWAGGRPLSASRAPRLHPGLIGASSRELAAEFEVEPAVQGRLGDSRWLGSTAYELALLAQGSLDYGAFASAAVWDVAAGVTLVREAGGLVLRYDLERVGWFPLEDFQRADGGPPAALRAWDEPLLAGGAAVVGELASQLRPSPSSGGRAASPGRIGPRLCGPDRH